MQLKETDVYQLVLARRDNYAITHMAHQHGRIYTVDMDGKRYRAVVLLSSYDYYEYRYHIASRPPSLVICYEHTTVLPVAVLSIRMGNFAKPYELPETIEDIYTQRRTKIGSQVILGMYISGMQRAQTLVNTELPPTTRQRYLHRAKALGKRKRGRPVCVGA
jgi:hypothetical protein